jgi:uncharacterized protein (TIGR03118 family)
MKSSNTLITIAICAGSLASSLLADPISGYVQTVLASSITDPDLVNPWGISSSSTSPFWVSDNASGKATLYNSAGVKQALVVSMPAGGTDITGQVFNGTNSFNSDVFLFASENGTIDGWRGALGTTAEILDNVAGADYKGLAISNDKSTLFAANFTAGTIDEFSSAGLVATFSDPNIPAGFAPFNIQNIGGVFYVTFAKQGAGGDDSPGVGNGFVDTFDPTSHTFTRLVTQGVLDSPWGLAVAPATFGPAGGDLLVGNFGDGTINAYDPVTGALIGTLADPGAASLVTAGLWGLIFGNGGNGGSVDSLYTTSGGTNETVGVLTRIDAPAPVPEPALTWLMGAGVIALALGRKAAARRGIQ